MYTVLLIPDFKLQAALRAEGVARGSPVVLAEEVAHKSVVTQMTAAAAEAGVYTGMPIPRAMAREPALTVLTPTHRAEQRATRTLFGFAYCLTPKVEQTAPGVCTADLSGSDPDKLEESCGTALAQLREVGLHACIGVAGTPALARLAAKTAAPYRHVEDVGDFLADLPVSLAEPPQEMLHILLQWGIRTLGAFADLPRDSVGRRLGPKGLELWDQLFASRSPGETSRSRELLDIFPLPEKFEERLDLDYGLQTLEPLLFLLRGFLDRLCERLAGAHQCAHTLLLELLLENGGAHRRRFKTPEPTGKAEILFRMLDAHLGQLSTPSPITGMSLRILPCDPRERQLSLFDTEVKNPHKLSQTLSRLAGIAGPERVGRPVVENSHRPDAFHLAPLPDILPALTGNFHADTNADAETAPLFGLPLRRLRPPLPVRVLCTGNRPTSLSSRRVSGIIRARRGPWANSGEWWENAKRWRRLEWDVELEKGGLYRIVREERRWFVEGIYD